MHTGVPVNDVSHDCRSLCASKKADDEEEEDTHESHLEIHFFSLTTFYWMVHQELAFTYWLNNPASLAVTKIIN